LSSQAKFGDTSLSRFSGHLVYEVFEFPGEIRGHVFIQVFGPLELWVAQDGFQKNHDVLLLGLDGVGGGYLWIEVEFLETIFAYYDILGKKIGSEFFGNDCFGGEFSSIVFTVSSQLSEAIR
jgi:hypothetical protein